MKNVFTFLISLMFAGATATGQTIEITSPTGMTPPYEVAPGTEITFQWEYFGSAPTAYFTHTEQPVLPDFGLDPEWQQHSGFTDNGDGTANFTHTFTEETWIWAGYYQSFFNTWAYSNIVHVSIASGVEITFEDGLVCPDGSTTENLTTTDSYASYQWYLNGVAIEGATEQTYGATLPGQYKVEVPLDGTPTFSNTLVLVETAIEISGAFAAGDAHIDLSATANFDAYQWLSGDSPNNLTPITLATGDAYTASISAAPQYIAVEGTLNGCTVQSETRVVFEASFETPVITVSADTNAFGNVCVGTDVVMETPNHYGTYQWTKNGMEVFSQDTLLTVTQEYEEGEYLVEVSPVSWPEINLVSDPVNVDFFTLAQPELIVSPQGPYCPGQELTVTLGDEGYTYTWYQHTDFDYTSEDEIDVSGTSYTFTFEDNVKISVEAEFEGCTASRTLHLSSVGNNTPFIGVTNYDQQYLCTDSTAYLAVSDWAVDDYTNYQWYRVMDGTPVAIDGETGPSYGATETGQYQVGANPVSCTSLDVMSNVLEVRDYSEREMFIFADSPEICVGEPTLLNVSGGSDIWQNIQWFEGNIQMGSQGYEEVFVPIPGAGNDASHEVSEFNGYLAKARHASCPTGLKISSNIVRIKPAVNPTLSVDPDYGVHDWHMASYDSIPSYLYCAGEQVWVSAPAEYDSYAWHKALYTGDGGYELGDAIEGAAEPSVMVEATGVDWVTAVVELDGCVGHSLPILIDTWAFSPVTITSYNNSELCGPGDSTLIHVSFAGNYALVNWFRDGIFIPDAHNDSLWAKEPGMYTVTVYREECPDFGISSGVGPTVSLLEAWIVEDEDLIYAMPQMGQYTYQWYLDGAPYENNTSTPWILYKEDMPDGEYTVEVTNPEPCAALSEPFVWNTTGTADVGRSNLRVYPNPTGNSVKIEGPEAGDIAEITIRDIRGGEVLRQAGYPGSVDLSSLAPGAYLMEVRTIDNRILQSKVLKK